MELTVTTDQENQVIDVTERVQEHIPNATGVCTVFVRHTTCAMSTADLDPGTDLDMLDAFYAMVPKLDYRHPHDPSHVPDHILATLIGPSVQVAFKEGQLFLGTWQCIVLFTFNGPKTRNLHISVSSA